MKQFFMDGDKLSMGRLLSMVVVINALIVFNIEVFTATRDIGSNVAMVCQWMIGIGIFGKGVQKIGESLKK